MDKVLGTPKETFVRYVAYYDKCHSVYSYKDCRAIESSMQIPQVCKQRTSNYGRPCNGTLLKRIELLGSKIIYHPKYTVT